MKIDKRITSTTVGKVSGTQGKGGSARAGKSGKSSGGDQLSITASSSTVRSMEAELAGVDVTDTAKIESVKAAIADGSFTVNAEVVADRLIDEAKQNLRRRPKKK